MMIVKPSNMSSEAIFTRLREIGDYIEDAIIEGNRGEAEELHHESEMLMMEADARGL